MTKRTYSLRYQAVIMSQMNLIYQHEPNSNQLRMNEELAHYSWRIARYDVSAMAVWQIPNITQKSHSCRRTSLMLTWKVVTMSIIMAKLYVTYLLHTMLNSRRGFSASFPSRDRSRLYQCCKSTVISLSNNRLILWASDCDLQCKGLSQWTISWYHYYYW